MKYLRNPNKSESTGPSSDHEGNLRSSLSLSLLFTFTSSFIYNAVTSKSHSRTNILILFNYINRRDVESGSENSTSQQINVPKVVYPRVVSGRGGEGKEWGEEGEQCRYESRVGLNSIVKHATRRSRFTIEMPRSYKFRASSLATLHTHSLDKYISLQILDYCHARLNRGREDTLSPSLFLSLIIPLVRSYTIKNCPLFA